MIATNSTTSNSPPMAPPIIGPREIGPSPEFSCFSLTGLAELTRLAVLNKTGGTVPITVGLLSTVGWGVVLVIIGTGTLVLLSAANKHIQI